MKFQGAKRILSFLRRVVGAVPAPTPILTLMGPMTYAYRGQPLVQGSADNADMGPLTVAYCAQPFFRGLV